MGSPDYKGRGGNRDRRGNAASWVSLDFLEPLECRGRKALEASRVRTGKMASSGRRDLQGRRDLEDCLDRKAERDRRAREVRKDRPVRRAGRERKDCPEIGDPLDCKAPKDPLGRNMRCQRRIAEGGFPIELHSITVQTLHG